MGDHPPDLDRLGHALTRATARDVKRRNQRAERRRRLCGCVLAGLLVFAAMTPSHLGRADQPNFLPFAIEPAGAPSGTAGRPLERGRPGREELQERALAAFLPRPKAPICFHLDSGFAGHTSHTMIATTERQSPVAIPGLSP